MKAIILFLPIIAIFFLDSMSSMASFGTWERLKHKKGVEVFKKEIPGSKVVAFRGETILNGTVAQVFNILLDNSRRKEWVDRLEESVILEEKSSHEYTIYQQFFLPWPLKNREFVYQGNAYIDRHTKDVVIHMQSTDKHPPIPHSNRKDAVRAELKSSYYYLTKLGENQTKVVVEVHSDPKGHIPAWVVNLVQSSWPVKTLNGVKGQLYSIDANKEYTLPDLPISAN